jgi:hypothetical protein
MPQQDGTLTNYPSSIDYYSDEWTHDWSTSVSSTVHFNPCDNPNPPWWCEEQSVPIEPNILMIIGMFMYGIALLAQSVRAPDS